MGAYEFWAYIAISKELIYGTPSGYTGTEQYMPGGTLTYIITYRNISNGTPTNTSIEDGMPLYTNYAIGTLRMGDLSSSYDTAIPKTDALDGDNAEFVNDVAIFRIGQVKPDDGGRCYFRVYIK